MSNTFRVKVFASSLGGVAKILEAQWRDVRAMVEEASAHLLPGYVEELRKTGFTDDVLELLWQPPREEIDHYRVAIGRATVEGSIEAIRVARPDKSHLDRETALKLIHRYLESRLNAEIERAIRKMLTDECELFK